MCIAATMPVQLAHAVRGERPMVLDGTCEAGEKFGHRISGLILLSEMVMAVDQTE